MARLQTMAHKINDHSNFREGKVFPCYIIKSLGFNLHANFFQKRLSLHLCHLVMNCVLRIVGIGIGIS